MSKKNRLYVTGEDKRNLGRFYEIKSYIEKETYLSKCISFNFDSSLCFEKSCHSCLVKVCKDIYKIIYGD